MKRVVLIISVALMFVMISASSYAATVTYSASAMADQGLTGTRTLKGLATSIGSSKQAIIVLSHTSSGNTTTYSMSQSVTLTSNITLKIEKGAVLSIAVGKTLTINGTLDAGEYQIFSGAGTVTVQNSIIYPEWWGGKGDDSTDNTTAIQAAINNLGVGRTVYLGQGTWRFGSQITWPVATLNSYQSFICKGVMAYTGTDAGSAIKIGTLGTQGSHITFEIYLYDANGSTWSTDKKGVELLSVNNVDGTIGVGKTSYSGGFKYGLYIYGGSSDSVSYGNFYLRYFYDNWHGVHIGDDVSSGWANENNFYGGSFSTSASVSRPIGDAEWTGSMHVYNDQNNNKFYGPSFESDNIEYFFYNNGLYTTLFSPRMEGTPKYRLYNDTGGSYLSYYISYLSTSFDPSYNMVDLTQTAMILGDRVNSPFGRKRRSWGHTGSTIEGTFFRGDILALYNPSYGSNFLYSNLRTGTTSTETPASDAVTDGATNVISMSDASAYHSGQYVTISAGFPSSSTAYRIIDVTDTSISVDNGSGTVVNSTSSATGVTVGFYTPDWQLLLKNVTNNVPQVLSYHATTMSIDFKSGDVCTVTATGNLKLNNPSNIVAGKTYYFKIIANTGGAAVTISYDTYYKAATTSLTNGKSIVLEFVATSTTSLSQINTPIEI
jgi:hypothetical protein